MEMSVVDAVPVTPTADNRPQGKLLLEHAPILLGAGGMLHRAWAGMLQRWGIPHRNFTRKNLDLSRPETIERSIDATCRLVINCAAYTDVDGAEKDEMTATLVNGSGVGELAERCRNVGAMLIHYSTDYVFNGHGERPYRTDDPIEPLNAYGRSKAVGERLIRESGCEHLILRTSWLYAPWGKNFVRTIARLVKEGKTLRIVNDQTGRPTSSEHLAWNSVRLIEKGAEGTFHLTDGGECTWNGFAREIARHIDPSARVDSCTTAELARPAPRPAYSVLDLEKTEALLGPLVPWQATLADVMSRLE